MPHLWCVDAVQSHTELGAIVCNESHRIPIGYLLDESFDGTDVSLGGRGKDADKQWDKKEGDT